MLDGKIKNSKKKVKGYQNVHYQQGNLSWKSTRKKYAVISKNLKTESAEP